MNGRGLGRAASPHASIYASAWNSGRLSLGLRDADSIGVKIDECLSTQPIILVHNDAIGEVAASLEKCEPGLGRTGLISIRPSVSRTTATLSPGWMAGCCKISFFRVIWPLAVTVRAFIGAVLPCPKVRHFNLTLELSVVILAVTISGMDEVAAANGPARDAARRAAIHPVASVSDLRAWLARLPATKDFPPDLVPTLREGSSLFVIEMSTAPGCIPCGDLWVRLARFRSRYGWQVRTITGERALLRSGRLGLPWVGHPVAWVRPLVDQNRTVPIAIGTDLDVNLARNVYLAAKILTGVKPAIGVRAMSKFSGIVGASGRAEAPRR